MPEGAAALAPTGPHVQSPECCKGRFLDSARGEFYYLSAVAPLE